MHGTNSRDVNFLTTLRLVPGMAVDVRGQLVVRDDALVLTGHRMVTVEPGREPTLPWPLTPFVPLDFQAGGRLGGDEAEQLLGKTVYGEGQWTGEAVQLHSLSPDHSGVRDISEHETAYTKDLTPVEDHVRTVETPLFADGRVLRRVRLIDEYGPRVIVSATDVEAAEAALRPIYGDTLEIHKSHWQASDIRALDDVLNDLPEERVLKVEYRMDGNGLVSRRLRVDRVDDEIAHALSRFPDEMLVVEAVVEPAGTPQDRDPWFPARPRTGPGPVQG